ncbi:MAG: hypothetical protein LBO79_05095 [Zoogloeaceae bacterium]|nr:hypothetical protein [Zoogloeaceae bacterium]
MSARMAAEEAFRQAKVDHSSPSLVALRFAVERSGGKAVIRVTSSRPINDPFMDFLVELDWPSGRLVRQYTFLLDPPEVLEQKVERPQVAAPAKILEAPVVPAVSPDDPKPPSAVAVVAEAGEHAVKRGETLRGIAAANVPEGVTLEQMLVALYRNNTGAFIGKNMNRLRSGAVLRIPSRDEAASVPVDEARRTFRTQASEWRNYRNKLAAVDFPDGKTSKKGILRSGKDEQRELPLTKKDRVEVSPANQKGGPPSEEDKIAAERELRDAKDRVADLERIVKSQSESLARLERQLRDAKSKEPVTRGDKKTDDNDKSEDDPEPVPSEVNPPFPSSLPESRSLGMPVETSLVVLPMPVSADFPAPVSVVASPQVEDEPVKPSPVKEADVGDGDVDGEEEGSGILPWAIGGGLALVAAILGIVFVRRRKSGGSGETSDEKIVPDLSSPLEPESHSIFQEPGGQSVDTSVLPEAQQETSGFSEFTKGAGAFEEGGDVDPINEADLYLGYGKDAQAEEILLDALQKDPHRLSVSIKLLEVYALRGSVKQFDALASEVYAQTGGGGEDWAKVVALGQEVNPSNPLYGGSSATSAMPSDVGSATDTALDFSFAKTDIDPHPLPSPEFDFGGTSTSPASSGAADFAGKEADAQVLSGSFDVTRYEEPQQESVSTTDVDLSFTSDFSPTRMSLEQTVSEPPPVAGKAPVAEPPPVAGVESDIPLVVVPDIAQPVAREASPPAFASPSKPVSEDVGAGKLGESTLFGTDSLAPDVEFDVALTESTVLEEKNDLYDIDDLDTPAPAVQAPPLDTSLLEPRAGSKPAAQVSPAATPPSGAFDESRRDEVNTKLELAQAYEDMGDVEGARELLNEVLNEGAPDQVEQAGVILGRLGA